MPAETVSIYGAPEDSGEFKNGYEYAMKQMRSFVPSFGELIDRLCITSQKEIFIPEQREVYTKQINEIIHDLDMLCQEKDMYIDGNVIRAIIVLTQMNTWIWQNEKNRRNNIEDGNDLSLTHSLNTIRTQCFSLLSQMAGDRGEFKKDAAIPHKDWIPSLFDEKKPLE